MNYGFFLPCLQVLFIGLKLCKVITWGWFLVLMPIIAIPALILIVLFVYLLVLAVENMCSN